MNEKNKLLYQPNNVSPPGYTLEDLLDEKGMSQAELAKRIGRPTKTINEIISGKAAITPETALQLERALGVQAEFWNQREANYRAFLAREKELEHLSTQINWLKKFPLKEMIERKWITLRNQTTNDKMISILNFFGVASPEQWENGWTKRRLAFRKSRNLNTKLGAISVWLRQGELIGEKINCKPFNRDLLIKSIPKIRELTKERNPKIFTPKLKEICAFCGIALVFVEPFKGVPIYGSSSWLNPEKALIILSLRGKTADILWFTIFHELAHILKHSKKELFVDIDGLEITNSPEEKEADDFAANTLIEESALVDWLAKSTSLSTKNICEFAENQGIAPGIVVGRLQYIKKIPYCSRLNKLKFKYQWPA